MLGGALGGIAGKLTSNVICNGTAGFITGAVSSLMIYMVLLFPVYIAATYITQNDFGEHTVGNYESDVVASVLGGISGVCASLIVTVAMPSHGLSEPHAFALCWSTATIVPLLLTLGLAWFVHITQR
jgi:hypothetical protein